MKNKEIFGIIRAITEVYAKRNLFFHGEVVNIEKVVNYKKQILYFQQWLNDYYLDEVFFVKKERLDSLKRFCNDEIKICDFYLSYPKIQRSPDFNVWIVTEEKNRLKQDRLYREGYQKEGKAITKTNGKIKAIIEVKENQLSTRITLFIINDNKYLRFCDKQKYSEKNLRSKESIEKEIERLKQQADTIFWSLVYPKYSNEIREMDIYKELVWVI